MRLADGQGCLSDFQLSGDFSFYPVERLSNLERALEGVALDKIMTAFALATSTEKIVGTWVAGNYCLRFDKDGTFRQAHALDKLDSQPFAISSYQFEGAKIVITEVSVPGVPTCGKKIGRYEIQLLESGNIRIVAIKDQCAPRAGDVAAEYEPVR